MSKYNSLWLYIKNTEQQSLQLSFDEIKSIAGIALDHSFLNYKKKLLQHSYKVEKISLKDKTVYFKKMV